MPDPRDLRRAQDDQSSSSSRPAPPRSTPRPAPSPQPQAPRTGGGGGYIPGSGIVPQGRSGGSQGNEQPLTYSDIARLQDSGQWQPLIEEQRVAQAQLESDFEALQSQTYDQIQDWRGLASLAYRS